MSPLQMMPGWADGMQNLPDIASGIMRIINPKLDLQLATRQNMAMHPDLKQTYIDNEALHPGSTRKWLGDSHLTDMIEQGAKVAVSPHTVGVINTRNLVNQWTGGKNNEPMDVPSSHMHIPPQLFNNPNMMTGQADTSVQPTPASGNIGGAGNPTGAPQFDFSRAASFASNLLGIPDDTERAMNYYRAQNFGEDAKLAPVRARLMEAQTNKAELDYQDASDTYNRYHKALTEYPNPNIQRMLGAIESGNFSKIDPTEMNAISPTQHQLLQAAATAYQERQNRATQLTLESMRKQSTDKQTGTFILSALSGRRTELQDRISNANSIIKGYSGLQLMQDQAAAKSATDPATQQAAQTRLDQRNAALQVLNQNSSENLGLKDIDTKYNALFNSIAGKYGIKTTDVITPAVSPKGSNNDTADPAVVKQVLDRIKSGAASIDDFSRTKNAAITPAVVAAVRSQLNQPKTTGNIDLGDYFMTPRQRKEKEAAKTAAQTKSDLDVLLGKK